MTRNEFIGKVAGECISNDVSLKIIQKGSVCNYSGWFDANRKELVCAYKSPNGFETLIHEYNHFIQWKDNHDFWKKCDGYNNLFLAWKEGFYDDITKNKLTRAFNKAVELERDCEIQSIKCIKKYNLDVDIKKYIKEANSYLFSYHFVRNNRDWPNKSIYTEPLVSQMPEEILPFENYKKGVDKEGKSVIFLYERLST
jgi:hypothetical protein